MHSDYPAKEAVHVASLCVRKFMEKHVGKVKKIIAIFLKNTSNENLTNQVDRVIFTVFSDADRKIYEKELHNYFPTKTPDPTHSSPKL